MNIRQMLVDQKKLDDEILSNAGVEEYPLENMKLALLVELGELANEWQGFKHWKKHKEINRERLLDEFADCLHFGLSLENQLHQVSNHVKDAIEEIVKNLDNECKNKDVLEGFKYVFNAVLDTTGYISPLLSIIALGRCLDISLDEMEQSYYRKNKVNYKRQQEGY